MKAFHRIRRNLILLLFLLHTAHGLLPQIPRDFKMCGGERAELVCSFHATCIKPSDRNDRYYTPRDQDEVANIIKNNCVRYLIIRANSPDKVEIEFRDDTLKNTDSAVFKSISNTKTFTCGKNNATSDVFKITDVSSASDKLYCKFVATAKNYAKNILTALTDASLDTINVGVKSTKIGSLGIGTLHFQCAWDRPLFKIQTNYETLRRDDEEYEDLTTSSNRERTCKHFNWYSANYPSDPKDPNAWTRIDKFTCAQGVITTTNTEGKDEPLDFDKGFIKCSRPKCSTCPPLKGSMATFTKTDGKSCVTITCPKAMLVETADDLQYPHSNKTLQCAIHSTTSAPKWEGYNDNEIKNVTCVDEVSCMLLDPINSTCPAVIPEDKNCTEAQLNSTINPAVCAQDQEIWFKPQADKVARQVTTFTCSTKSGKWEVANVPSATNGNVYCLKVVEKIEEEVVAPQKGSAGQLIGIICGVAFVVIIIIIVFVFCAQRHFKKKGNRDEMKSVSVTGRGDKKSKKKKDKKSKSSSSATSEISAPPPPPCPDSLPGLKVEPDLPPPSAVPPSFTAVCPPSSGGASGKGGEAAAVPIVGPDTGKPDKPAELIDIKLLESEKKTEKESSRKSDKDKDQEATLVNTVTGTQSGAEPVKNDATDTKKTDKHGESSDTGRNTKTGTKTKKDIKKQVDKHGRGLTDDDDYNINEGAKPVNHVDKNKKPYAPAVDPRKKMTNVTMTEDEEGHLKPRGKDSPF